MIKNSDTPTIQILLSFSIEVLVPSMLRYNFIVKIRGGIAPFEHKLYIQKSAKYLPYLDSLVHKI